MLISTLPEDYDDVLYALGAYMPAETIRKLRNDLDEDTIYITTDTMDSAARSITNNLPAEMVAELVERLKDEETVQKT